MTRMQVADCLGVSKVAVRKWETGLAMPNADKLPVLADLLHCTIDALYGRPGLDSQTEKPAEPHNHFTLSRRR